MESFVPIYDSDSASDNEASEKPLNLSATQLVQIMNCAMKRKQSSAMFSSNKKQKCIETAKSQASNPTIQMCSSPSLLTSKSKQELIQRNKYLERRVKELEKLNHTLQFSLTGAIRETIVDTLTKLNVIPNVGPDDHAAPLSPCEDVAHERNMNPGQQQEPVWDLSRNSDPTVNSVTSSSSKTPDTIPVLCTPSISTNDSQAICDQNLQPPEQQEFIFCDQVGSSLGLQSNNVKSEIQYCEQMQADVPTSMSPSFRYSQNMANKEMQLFGPGVIFENGCQNTLISPSIPMERVQEMTLAAMECTNYKKLTNKLLNIFFEREELASSTLTGKSKGERAKCKLNESTVSLIINQVMLRFPGTTASDVRVIISQNCKDKALRFYKHAQSGNRVTGNRNLVKSPMNRTFTELSRDSQLQQNLSPVTMLCIPSSSVTL